MGPYRRLLVVVKQTPFEMYSLMKQQGRAPLSLRWERLRNRHQVHRSCVAEVCKILETCDVEFHRVGRQDLDRQHLEGVDLVVAIGGDGTVLSSSHFLDDKIPLLGINSDPTLESEREVMKKADERRSMGALCACTAANMRDFLPRCLRGEHVPEERSRLQAIIRGAFTEVKLRPALNDLLFSHPVPAAVSRFRLKFDTKRDPSSPKQGENGENSSGDTSFTPHELELGAKGFNTWSSGLWVASATGSSGAINSAGGVALPVRSASMQYLIRELLTDGNTAHLKSMSRGVLRSHQELTVRWSSLDGRIFVDGQHVVHPLQLGDEVSVSTDAPKLLLIPPARDPGTTTEKVTAEKATVESATARTVTARQ